MKVSFIFAWYDLWIGLYWDKKNKWLYFLPLPCIGLIFKFKKQHLTTSVIQREDDCMTVADHLKQTLDLTGFSNDDFERNRMSHKDSGNPNHRNRSF